MLLHRPAGSELIGRRWVHVVSGQLVVSAGMVIRVHMYMYSP